MSGGDRRLWHAEGVDCWMISCCAGAELQIVRGDTVLLRELYPSKSDLYERARSLKRKVEEDGGFAPDGPS